jgi:hypothetical protein
MDIPTGPDGRLAAFGNQLIEIHLWLREELTRLRADVGSHLDGEGRPARSRGGRPEPGRRELAAHCLAFCSALGRHHTGEDGGAFTVLAARFPGLRPVLDELERDHQMVAGILRRLAELLDGTVEAQRVGAEFDGLTALLESHFGYEEKKLVAALNSLDTRAWTTEDLLGIPVPADE